MNEEVKQKVAKLLDEASKLLVSADSQPSNINNPTPRSNAASSGSSTASSSLSFPLGETLQRARGMLQASSSSGLFRRLNRTERLRASSPYQQNRQSKTKPSKQKVKKAMEFSLLRCWADDDEDEPHHLKWDSVLASGMLTIDEDDNEKSIRKAIKDSLASKIPALGDNDFEFVKIRHKAITKLELGPGTEFNYAVVKKMAGQGQIYVKVKQGYDFLYDLNKDDDDDDELLKSYVEPEIEIINVDATKTTESAVTAHAGTQQPTEKDPETIKTIQLNQEETSPCANLVDNLIDEITSQSLHDPVEILRFLQKNLVKGRVLDVEDTSEIPEGETNYICVDRHNIMGSTFSELEAIQDFHVTFEVDFIGEMAKDVGGPRKEWIRLMNAAMKDKYFDKGLREYLADDYYYVGIMIGIALLQNGQLPTFMPHDVIESLVSPNLNPCIAKLREGLNVFGLARIMEKFPILLHLLRHNNQTLSAKMVLKLLAPTFSEEGSSMYFKEKALYALFVKYVRQVASGRREPITLSSLLIFATCASEEPPLGFVVHPSITFTCKDEEPMKVSSKYEFIPKAHTCTNNMVLSIGSITSELPSEEELFEVFDFAFANAHFGNA
ncbi:uncharacterized protein LOC114533337 [Dendronephthya gigantea]|uniref:uncharacterized protein LOC114531366 n=1 Tax=Dendronephthya gigantea TaxID=151771 RepID=UPI001069839D|nr:uncharacterized protein LOC114531366 [Dendronephthya gigantea]XP_028410647.1 uncharacterized protein LOC114533337 [Dendronephthya gigantea]